MIVELLKAVLVGMIAALPIGPIVLMVIQRTLSEGRRAGLMVGAGSAVADAFYAAIGLLALSLVEEFVAKNSKWFLLVGGVLIAIIGISMIRKKMALVQSEAASMPPFKYALHSMVSVFSNPAAIAVMMALLAAFSLGVDKMTAPFWLVAICVGLGEWLYWNIVVLVLNRFVHPKAATLELVSKIVGGLVCVFAVVLVVRGVVLFF